MTNPNNAIGANAAYGTRTSANAFNDLGQTYSGRGIISGWAASPAGGMVVDFGGVAGVRDVALAEDNLGNFNTINNRSGSAVSITFAAASVSSARYSAVVAYVNNPAQASNEDYDAPSACGIIEVQGSSGGVSEAQIRAAITSDGGTGSIAYYVVLATVYIDAGATTISSANISQSNAAIRGEVFGAGSIPGSALDWASMGFEDRTSDITFDSAINHGNFRLYKKANVCLAIGSFTRSGGFTTGYKTIGTLPSDCKPVISLTYPTQFTSNGTGLPITGTGVKIRINKDTGLIDTNCSSSSGSSDVLNVGSIAWVVA